MIHSVNKELILEIMDIKKGMLQGKDLKKHQDKRQAELANGSSLPTIGLLGAAGAAIYSTS